MKRNLSKLVLPLLLLSGVTLTGCGNNSSVASIAPSSSASTSTSTPSSSVTPTPSSSSVTPTPSSSSATPTPSSSSSSSTPAPSSSSIKEEITVSITGAKQIKIDESVTLTATVENATDSSVTWSTSKAAVATVNNGVVLGVGVGTTTITATSVEDNTKKASVDITVVDKYDVRITENKTYTAEVENIDLSGFVVRGDVASIKADGEACLEPSDEATYGTSGGKSIGFIGAGTVFTVNFFATKDCVVTPMARMASPDATFDVDSNIKFAVDQKAVISNGYDTFGSTATNTYWNWKDVELTPVIVAEGVHTFTYTCTGSAINLDCFKLAVTDYENTSKYYSINKNGTITAEVENLDLSKFVVRGDVASIKADGAACIETSDEATYGTSGGKSIGFIGKGTVLTVNLNLENEAVVTPVVRLASADATFDVDTNSSFKVDETSVNSNGYNTFGSDGTNAYYNWKDVNLTSVTLKAGFHTFTYECLNSAINLDCFKFVIAYYGDVASAGYQIEKNGTTAVEAESIKVTSGSYSAEAPSGDALNATSGGKSIGNVAKDTVFNINFNLHNKATVKLVAVMAKPEADYTLTGNVTFALDSKEQTPAAVTFGSAEGNTYWNWKDVEFYDGSLGAGMHTITLTAANAFPNMDCVKIVTSGYGDDFAVSGNKTVKIEGDDVDKTNLISDGGSSFIESSTEEVAATSGQSCLCHASAGSFIESPFYVDGTADLVVTCRLSKNEALVVNDTYSIYVDGTKVAWSDLTQTLGRASDGSNDWHNWKLCSGVSQALTKGDHTFKFSYDNNGGNIDYIDFAFTNYAA